ncbi:acyl-CoA reductase [Rubrivivax gelatinosus]|uniref:Putative acyl-CoA reductase LuxC n=1 Tax=Rubrivivax gelatinosus (strain NBRC 100245 / IL144) TaxID=983917 RepID=I0HWT3_RUBGI|nr:acyl-CoA reductase [Rubrivivax gelatinosus]BAL97470.1 putative acyl-CoA reductase LuxC [Rubrivivax gelatinosus IL144]
MTSADLDVVLPKGATVEAVVSSSNLPPFGKVQLAFANELAKALTRSPAVRAFPELVALGFWLRAANLTKIIDSFLSTRLDEIHLARGLVFHVSPSNVDTIFVYSWFVSLLCGNRNIIRLSSKSSPQTSALLTVLERLLSQDEWNDIAKRTLIVRYGHDVAASSALSACCDVRVIWGGDATINTFRSIPLNPRATELAFANKFSLAVLDASSVANAQDRATRQLAANFYNDVYWFGQMACSSPRMVIWLGSAEEVELACSSFWPALKNELDRREFAIAAPDHMNKEVLADALAIDDPSVRITEPDARITRVWMSLARARDDLHCGAGLFHEARINSLDELNSILDRKIQTVSYFGIPLEDWSKYLRTCLPTGIDRIVPIGSALNFDSVWDGQDMLVSFTRQITIR